MAMERAGKCKSMEKLRCWNGMRRLGCIAFCSFGCCRFVKHKGNQQPVSDGVGMYQISQKGGHTHLKKKPSPVSFSMTCSACETQIREENKVGIDNTDLRGEKRDIVI